MMPNMRHGSVYQGGRRYLKVNFPSLLTFVALSALILNPIFGPRAASVFLLFGILLIAAALHSSLRAFTRYWYILLIPLFCIVSLLWSQFPSETLRYSLQLTVTFLIAIAIGASVTPARLLHCIFGAYGIGVVGSVLFGRVRDDIGAWLGIFGSKNAFASHISVFTLAALAVLFDKSASQSLRRAALLGMLAAGPLLVKGQSVGAVLPLIPAALISMLVLLSRRLSSFQKLFTVSLIGVFLLFGLAIVLIFGTAMFDALLSYSGKDVTLTGRTELWEYGWQTIAENPLFGLGYQAFWVQGYDPAEALWDEFGITARMGFNFHNTYISNAVEIGFIGLALEIFILYSALFSVLIWAARSPQPANAFFASLLVLIVFRSFVEVEVFYQFGVSTIMVITSLVYARHFSSSQPRRKRRQLLFGPEAEDYPFGFDIPPAKDGRA